MKYLDILSNNIKAKILRISLRFGAPKNMNDTIVNFDYNGQMICELKIKMGQDGKIPLLYHYNKFIS